MKIKEIVQPVTYEDIIFEDLSETEKRILNGNTYFRRYSKDSWYWFCYTDEMPCEDREIEILERTYQEYLKGNKDFNRS